MARTYRELEVWRLAFELAGMVDALTAAGSVQRRRKYCEQLQDSSQSVARNIAEGFGRYNPAEFARFLGIARASLLETDSALRFGVANRYFTAEAAGPIILTGARCHSGINRLQSYLRGATNDPQFTTRTSRRKRRT